MPHLQVSITPFLVETLVIESLLEELTEALASFESVKKENIKAYVTIPQSHCVGGRFDLEFCHVSIMILEGRSVETRKKMSEVLGKVVKSRVRTDRATITVEVREMETDSYFKV